MNVLNNKSFGKALKIYEDIERSSTLPILKKKQPSFNSFF